VQVDPIKPTLKAPGSQRFKPDCHRLLSNFVFKCNLRRYSVVAALRDTTRLVGCGATFVAAVSQTIMMSPVKTAKLGPDAAALTPLPLTRFSMKEVFYMAGCCNFKPVFKAPDTLFFL